MKRILAIVIVLALCLAVNGFISPTTATSTSAAEAADPQKVLAARIENMLNNSNVFGEEFVSNEALVNKSAVMLREYADEDGFIPEDIVIAYVKDMYGISLVITPDINAGMPQKEGCVYLIPKGYSVYTHRVISVEETTDCITVISEVSADYHDASGDTATAKTILVRNASAGYGFNILNSELTYHSTLDVM